MPRSRVPDPASEAADVEAALGALSDDSGEPNGVARTDEPRAAEAAARPRRRDRPHREHPRPQQQPSHLQQPMQTQPQPQPQPPDGVSRNEPNVLFKFEEANRVNPNAMMTISLRRLTGQAAQWMIDGRPRTANELYAEIKRRHGRFDAATYEVVFYDSNNPGGSRGTGNFSMPSTLDELPAPPPQGQPSMIPNPYAQPVAFAAPAAAPAQTPLDGSTLLAMQRQMFDMMQQMLLSTRGQPVHAAAAAPPAPSPAVHTASDGNTLLAMQKQIFEMMQQMQATVSGGAPPPAVAPPPAAPVAAPTDLLAVQRQMFEMMQQMQAAVSGVAAPAAPQPAAATDSMSATLAMQKQMFDMMLTMMRTVQGMSPSAPGAGPYRGPGPGYRGPAQGRYPGYGSAGEYPPPDGHQPPYAPGYPQQQPKSMADQFREATTVINLATDLADRFRPPQAEAQAPAAPEPDDSPIRVIETGPAKIVINKKDGSARLWETVVSNSPAIFKWVGEQTEAIQKAARERETAKQQRQQLPPGYVEVGPGYQPPPGYVAVPVEPHQMPPQMLPAQPHGYPGGAQQATEPPRAQQPPLPPPPAQMPPPLPQQQSATPAQRRTWDLPEVTR